MSVTVSKAAGNTTFKYEIVAASAKLDLIIEQWAKYCWNNGYGVMVGSGENATLKDYATATNAEKFAAINARLKQLALDEVNTQEVRNIVVTPVKHDLIAVS